MVGKLTSLKKNHSILFRNMETHNPLKKKEKRRDLIFHARYSIHFATTMKSTSPLKKREKGKITRAIHHEIADLSLDSLVHPRLGRHPRAKHEEKQGWTEAAGDIQTFIVEILLAGEGGSRWEVIPARCSTHPRCHLRRRDNVSARVNPLRLG